MKPSYFSFILLLACSLGWSARAQAPLEFIENRGQWTGGFSYRAASNKADVYVEPDGFKYVLGLPVNRDLVDAYHHGLIKEKPVLKFHAYKVTLVGASPLDVVGSKKQQHYYNYFLGNDSTTWKSGIHPYLALDCKNVYPGTDLHIASEKGDMKYDFIVHPGSSADQIRMEYSGMDDIRIKEKNLLIETSVGNVLEMKPYAYQYVDGRRVEIECLYEMKEHVVGFRFPKGYDKSVPLVIDPTVVFCTFTGSTADNWGFTATYDNQGNFYAGGLVNGVGYPVSVGAFQVTFAGGTNTTGSRYPCDMAIMKLDPTGATKIWATYLGGSDNDQPHSMIVDASNNLIIAGRTYSSNFPVTNGCFDNTYNGGADIVLLKLNSTATALIGSTFLGGSGDDGVNFNADEFVFGGLKHNYGDDARSEVLIDNAQNIYLTASTQSANFPTTGTAIKNTLSPGDPQDAVVLKMNGNLSALTWSTYLGGSAQDAGYVLALDNTQTNIFVAGGTASSDFPATAGTLWPSFQGGSSDGFIAKFSTAAPFSLSRATFIGRGDYDQIYGIQTDISNNVYVMGQTLGGTFPVSAGVYSNPSSSQFILETNANLTTNLVSTVFGSGTSTQTNISPVAFLVDTCLNIYISGWGGGLGFSPATVGTTNNMPLSVAPNTPAQSTTDGNDFYFIVLSPAMQNLIYATYYGRSSTDAGKGEHVDGGTSRFDKNGVVYQAICGGCIGDFNVPTTPFPTTPGSLSPNNGNPSNCNEVALKIAFQLTNLAAHAATQSDTIGCGPLTIHFQNNSVNATSYLWTFGDGTTDTTFAPTHTFVTPGTYLVKLLAVNPNACNRTRDSAFIHVTVDSATISANFDYTIQSSCDPYIVAFNNKSTLNSKPGSAAITRFYWTFGDGTDYTGANPPVHTYPDTGTYTITLLMIDTTACNSPDTVQKTVTLSSNYVRAGFIGDSVCIGESILFSNNSSYATGYAWNFGNGATSNVSSPTYSFSSPGTYTVTLIASNPGTCNKFDTAAQVIQVWPKPTADFSYDPIIPVANEAIRFTNRSVNATRYYWGFGDGTSTTIQSPTHLYKRTGRYKVCLEAFNQYGCIDQVCKYVEAEIYPAVDVPTGFSPNGDGSNDILYVRGAAIETLSFKVYNRWGEMVFETDDITTGWDGTFKGKPQEVETYAWVLNVEFTDGTTEHRQGNVTLLR